MNGRPEGIAPEIEARPVVLEIDSVTHFFGNLRAVYRFRFDTCATGNSLG